MDLVQPDQDGWTVEDLQELPDNGMRYELVDGSLLVSPAPLLPHTRSANLLRRRLDAQAPDDIFVGQDGGANIRPPKTYLIPDIFVARASGLKGEGTGIDMRDVLVAVEVLSPSNRGTDLITKRHYYAAAGIQQYWLVDQLAQTLTVLDLDGDTYRELVVVDAGTTWRSDYPFPLALDPAEFM